MMRITCPFCGPRDHAEFLYGGDAWRQRPAEDDPDPAAWYRYVFTRSNPRGAHREYWQHVHGCRMWLCVTRDTRDHGIAEAAFAGPDTSDNTPAPAARTEEEHS